MNRLVLHLTLGFLICLVVDQRMSCGQEGLTPDSPEVHDMATEALGYLNGLPDTHPTLGGTCLRGLACYKYNRRYHAAGTVATDLAPIQQAVAEIRTTLRRGIDMREESINYSLGLAIVFLCEIEGEDKEFQPELQQLFAHLYDNQRPDGAWSYRNYQTGDTSQTQYGVLATWYALRGGYNVPPNSLARSIDWLIRTQDPSGAVPYQGMDPGNYNRVRQSDLRLSMSPAALGCYYITEELAGVSIGDKKTAIDSVFRPAVPKPKAFEIAVNQPMLRRAIQDGDEYYRDHFQLNIGKNFHYYLYSLERYQAMKANSEEGADGTKPNSHPWYDAGVKHLAATQLQDGSWDGTRGQDISTSFALLFLVRSMEVALEETAGGSAIGGSWLPEDLTRIDDSDFDRRTAQFKRPPSKAIDMDEFIDTIRQDVDEYQFVGPDVGDFFVVDNKESGTKEATQKRENQNAELAEILANGTPEQRLAVAKFMAKAASLEHVPSLIFALTDGDDRVTKVARDGLRVVSRKFNGFQLGDHPDTQEKEAAAKRWQSWYQNTRSTPVTSGGNDT